MAALKGKFQVRMQRAVPHYKSYPEEFADSEKRTGKPAPVRR
ncbi:MAG: hypothetical protein ABL900_17290 [Burkholderiaceae bacterium]